MDIVRRKLMLVTIGLKSLKRVFLCLVEGNIFSEAILRAGSDAELFMSQT